jgi:hypothetical protein
MNPPFIEKILLKATQRVSDLFQAARQTEKGLIVIFTCPVWKDAEYFQVLSKHPNLKSSIFLAKRTHFYEDRSRVGDQTVISGANSNLFVLDNFKTRTNYNSIASPCGIPQKGRK